MVVGGAVTDLFREAVEGAIQTGIGDWDRVGGGRWLVGNRRLILSRS